MERQRAWFLGRGVLGVWAVLGMAVFGSAFGEAFLIKDGEAQAEIVISEKPARMAKLAAQELQECLRKITGAKLPITTAPSKDCPVQVYVGESTHTERLGITAEGLKYDAFRMVSGDNWLVLLGRDADYTPCEPWARIHGDRPRALKEWDALTGAKWGTPHGSLFKLYSKEMDIWENDGRGSINAVYEFLRSLGARWYFPGELGEILPKQASVALPKIDKVFKPDFPVRNLHQYYNQFWTAPRSEILWQLRLGINSGREKMGATRGHGTTAVHSRSEVKKAHPEYFALWGERRDTEGKRHGKPCLSSRGLFEENVRYVRALYDLYGEPMVNVAPADGYSNLCQCPLC